MDRFIGPLPHKTDVLTTEDSHSLDVCVVELRTLVGFEHASLIPMIQHIVLCVGFETVTRCHV